MAQLQADGKESIEQLISRFHLPDYCFAFRICELAWRRIGKMFLYVKVRYLCKETVKLKRKEFTKNRLPVDVTRAYLQRSKYSVWSLLLHSCNGIFFGSEAKFTRTQPVIMRVTRNRFGVRRVALKLWRPQRVPRICGLTVNSRFA